MPNASTSLHIGLLRDEPFSSQCSLAPRCKWPGIAVEAIRATCTTLSLECTYSWFDSYEYGIEQQQNGSSSNWTGLIGALIDGRYDTSLPVFTPTYARSRVLDFSPAYFSSDTILVTRRMPDQPGTVILDWNVLNSFDWSVWILFVVFFIATNLHLALLHKIRRGSFAMPAEHYWYVGEQPLADRMAFLAQMLVQFILFSTFNGATFSNRMRSRVDTPFVDVSTLIDCIERHQCILVAPADSYGALNWFREQGGDRLSSAFESNPMLLDGADDEGVAPKILRRTEVYLTAILPKYVFLSQTELSKRREFYTVDVPFMDENAFPYPKRMDPTMRRRLDSMALAFQELGLSDALEKKYSLKADSLNGFEAPSKPVLRLASMLGILIFYGIGMIMALLAFALERFCVSRFC